MNKKVKEILLGITYGIITMLFMIGLLPWTMVSSIMGCVIAVVAIWRIMKKTRAEESVKHFTISYVAVIVVAMLIINSLSIGA
ncbi:MAG: hypothetical protein UH854_01340 [Clostridia bacterium]|nr:hypothetical protein [Clostridia bacterium]